MNLWNFD